MTVAGRRSLLITYSRKGISRLVRVALTRTRGISLDRKSVYEVLGGGGDESDGKTMQWIRTNCRILLPSSGPGRLTARPSPSTFALVSVFSSSTFSFPLVLSFSLSLSSSRVRHTRVEFQRRVYIN